MSELEDVDGGADLDLLRLTDFLASRVETFSTVDVRLQQFTSGHANLTYLLTTGGREYVVRRPPPGFIPKGAHDMVREANVLSALEPHYSLAPRVVASCDDESVIGVPFVVQQRLPGIVVRGGIPSSLHAGGRGATVVTQALLGAMADLHRVEPAKLDRSLGRPDGFAKRQVSYWAGRIEAGIPGAELLREIGVRLARRVPEPQRASVVHMDFKLDNVLFGAGEPEQVTGVLDWDMATVADPLVDLGILLAYWPEEGDPSSGHRVVYPSLVKAGLPSRSALVEWYAAESELDVARVSWFEALGLWKTAIISWDLYTRATASANPDPRLVRRDEYVVPLGEAALAALDSDEGK